MGKRWRKYRVGAYRLGQLHDQAVVVWTDAQGTHHRDPMTTRTVYAKADVESMRPAAEVVDMRIRRKG